MHKFRGLIPVLALLTVPLAPPAAADTGTPDDTGAFNDTGTPDDTGTSFELYGHLSPAVTSVDDGVARKNSFADNSHSKSRIGFRAFRALDSDYRLGFRFETAFGFRTTEDISQDDTPALQNLTREDIRRVDLQLFTPRFGTLFVGQGSMSSDGIGQIDLSGTRLVNDVSSSGDASGGFFFRNADSSLSDITVSDVLGDFDASRRGRIRYDTPEFAGVILSASYGKEVLDTDTDQEDFYTGVALAYSKVFDNEVEFAAGIAFNRRDRRPDEGAPFTRDDIYGSASLRLKSGVSLSVALGNRDTEGVSFDSRYYYLKAGYEAHWFGFGATAVSIDYFDGSDYIEEGDASLAWGVGVVQRVDAVNGEFSLGYRRNRYNQQLASFKPVDAVIAAARFSF
ncbi:MAG: porin [Pseudomonadota bacterium]